MVIDSGGDLAVHPALSGLLGSVRQRQRTGGYFCASGEIDWQQPMEGCSSLNTPTWPGTIKTLEKQGLRTMDSNLRRNKGCFVIGCGE
jgi:hypothetical protein